MQLYCILKRSGQPLTSGHVALNFSDRWIFHRVATPSIFPVHWMFLPRFRSAFFLTLWLIPHPCLWRLRMWDPLPPSLSPMHLSRSLLPHPLGARPPHTSAASCSSLFLAPTDVMTAWLRSKPCLLAFGVSLHKHGFCGVLFLSICFIV
jgi:hypothetical protein